VVDKKGNGVTGVVVILLILGGGAYWYYQQNKNKINTGKSIWDIFNNI